MQPAMGGFTGSDRIALLVLDTGVRPSAIMNFPARLLALIALLCAPIERTARAGKVVSLDAAASTDPDGHALHFEWFFYPESTGWTVPVPGLRGAATPRAEFTAPTLAQPADLHAILALTDTGTRPLTRYQRICFHINP